MFGYVRPQAKMLRVYQYEIYKSAYCGLCKTLKKYAGILPRLLLNYDFVALVLARMYFTNERAESELARCAAHPLKKRRIMKENKALVFSSGVFCAFLYAKAKDDFYDKKGLARQFSRLLCAYCRRLCKRMQKVCGFDLFKIAGCSERILALEKRGEASLDEFCAVFGEVLSECLCIDLCDGAKESAQVVGFQLGRYIYMCDAIDDLEEDKAGGSFNPLLLEYDSCEKARASICAAENVYLKGMYDAAEKIMEYKTCENESIAAILTNIFDMGAVETFRRVLKEKKNDRSV